MAFDLLLVYMAVRVFLKVIELRIQYVTYGPFSKSVCIIYFKGIGPIRFSISVTLLCISITTTKVSARYYKSLIFGLIY